MIELMAEKIAITIKQANKEETASIAVMKFALIIVINFLIPVILALSAGIITGAWAETWLTIAAFVTLRMMSGGYHFDSPVPCMLVTTAVMAIPPHVMIPDNWCILFTSFSLVLFLFLAPANLKGYNTMPE